MTRPATRTACLAVAIVAGVGSLLAARATSQPAGDPLAIFRPAVTVTPDDYARLARDQAVVKMLPTRGNQIGAFTAVRTSADSANALAWLRNICALKKGPFVKACGKFSSPPRLEDLDTLLLDDNDLTDIRRCRPNDCGLKLSAADLSVLQGVIPAAGANWKPAVQAAFRRLVFDRVQKHAAAKREPPPATQPVTVQDGFGKFPELFDFRWRPASPHDAGTRRIIDVPGGDSFLYWSKEQLGGRPIVGVMDITLLRPEKNPASSAIAASTQLYANHYLEASIGVTALVPAGDGKTHYLVYMNRSDVDLLGGFFSGLARMIMSRRIKNESAELLLTLRSRMERSATDETR